jgi:hypothetical protein
MKTLEGLESCTKRIGYFSSGLEPFASAAPLLDSPLPGV